MPPTPTPWVWVDGALVAVDDARISPFDHGLLVGDGVFETIRVYGGEPFAWTPPPRPARALGVGSRAPRPRSRRAARGRLRGALRQRPRRSPVAHHRHRRGRAPRVRSAGRPDRRWWSRAVPCGHGPTRCASSWCRGCATTAARPQGLKTTSYAENVRALAYAHERDASEAIFANTRDELCEATGSNVFVVRDGGVATPPGSSGCLLGVTRAARARARRRRRASRSTRRRSRSTRCATPTRPSSRPPPARCSPISHVDDRAVPSVPGPGRGHPQHRLQRPGRPTPRPLARRIVSAPLNPRMSRICDAKTAWGRSAEVVDVGGDDGVVGPWSSRTTSAPSSVTPTAVPDDVVAAHVLDAHGTTDRGEALPVVVDERVA